MLDHDSPHPLSSKLREIASRLPSQDGEVLNAAATRLDSRLAEAISGGVRVAHDQMEQRERRDRFAAAALTGLLANPELIVTIDGEAVFCLDGMETGKHYVYPHDVAVTVVGQLLAALDGEEKE